MQRTTRVRSATVLTSILLAGLLTGCSGSTPIDKAEADAAFRDLRGVAEHTTDCESGLGHAGNCSIWIVGKFRVSEDAPVGPVSEVLAHATRHPDLGTVRVDGSRARMITYSPEESVSPRTGHHGCQEVLRHLRGDGPRDQRER